MGRFTTRNGSSACRNASCPATSDVSDAIMEGAFDRGVDFSYSNELTIDHSIIVPMLFVRPEMDIPVVPILTNCIAPPMPRAKRYFEVGKAIRGAIDSLPDEQAHRRAGQRPLVPGSRRAETIRAPSHRPQLRRRRRRLDRQRRHRRRRRGLHTGQNDRLPAT